MVGWKWLGEQTLPAFSIECERVLVQKCERVLVQMFKWERRLNAKQREALSVSTGDIPEIVPDSQPAHAWQWRWSWWWWPQGHGGGGGGDDGDDGGDDGIQKVITEYIPGIVKTCFSILGVFGDEKLLVFLRLHFQNCLKHWQAGWQRKVDKVWWGCLSHRIVGSVGSGRCWFVYQIYPPSIDTLVTGMDKGTNDNGRDHILHLRSGQF